MSVTKWVSSEQWACTRHVPSLYMPAEVEGCLLCKERRPTESPPSCVQEKVTKRGKDTFGDLVKNCSFEGCLNPARINSKYCSKECSNKNARKRYKERLAA